VSISLVPVRRRRFGGGRRSRRRKPTTIGVEVLQAIWIVLEHRDCPDAVDAGREVFAADVIGNLSCNRRRGRWKAESRRARA
jgi:hypothetical protein